MLTISANVFHIELASTSFDDIESGLEAPSLPPILASTNNSSWPVLDVQGPNRIGEFTRSVGDSSDVYRIEIDAWEDSIHFVKIDIEGDINAFEIELVEKDQNDWSEVESKTKTVTLGKLTVALEVSRGTHFFRISMLNTTTNTAWGEYSEPTKYIAKLRDLKTDNNLLLLKTEMNAGHGGKSGRDGAIEEIALDYAFALKISKKINLLS